MEKMKGIVTPLVTPFTRDGDVDLESTRMLVDYMIAEGVHGLYPCGTTGEMLKMSIAERKTFAETVVSHAGDRIPVYIQVGAPTTAETVELARHAHQIGAKGIGVVTPQFFGVNERESLTFFTTVAKSVPADFPVYLYSIPQCAANDIEASLIDAIVAEAPNVVGIKYSGSDFVKLKDYLLSNGGDFDCIIGPDRLILPAMAMGCVGTVSGCSQCFPAPFVELYDAIVAEDWEEARLASIRSTELCEIVGAGSNIALFKAALRINGVIDSSMRAPALDLLAEEEEELAQALKAFKSKYGYDK